MQGVVDWWYANNFGFVWLSLAGLGATFFMIPKLVNRPLHSRQLAAFVLWTLIFFGSWCGIPSSAPVPAWIPVLSGLAAVLTIVALVALGLNIFRTKCGAKADCSRCAPGFICFGLGMFQLAGLMRAVTGLQETGAITNFTWFTVAQSHLQVYGFFAMTMFGVIYYAVPPVTGIEWPSPKLVRAHFWLAALGVLLFALPLAIGGVIQGLKLADPHVPFVDIIKSTLMFFRISTTGEVFLLIGHGLLLLNLIGLSRRYYKLHFVPAYKTAMAELKPTEVKS
jgi:cytochrome c oxidase cbb3-type subunit 1